MLLLGYSSILSNSKNLRYAIQFLTGSSLAKSRIYDYKALLLSSMTVGRLALNTLPISAVLIIAELDSGILRFGYCCVIA
jgi:hypothetical protein